MNVEKGTQADLQEIAAMGVQFFAEAGASVQFNGTAWASGWGALIASGFGVLWVTRLDGRIVGALGAIWGPDLNTGNLQAQEGFWWVKPEARGRGVALLKAFEAWARTVPGMGRIMMGSLQHNTDRLRILYARMGFEPVETNYEKRL